MIGLPIILRKRWGNYASSYTLLRWSWGFI